MTQYKNVKLNKSIVRHTKINKNRVTTHKMLKLFRSINKNTKYKLTTNVCLISQSLTKIEVYFSIPLTYEHLFCKYFVRRSVGQAT